MSKSYFEIFLDTEKQIQQSLLEKEKKPTLLLHACCAPCSSAILERLHQIFDITILFYNPNIYPQAEYERRRDELLLFIEKISVKIKPRDVKEISYEPDIFLESVTGLEDEPERGGRCTVCYKMRLQKTAIFAQERGYHYFTTSLSISPHKDSQRINELGKEIAENLQENPFFEKPLFLFADFKKQNGYKRSLEISSEYNLYRQKYCGCKFSMSAKKS